MDMESDAVSKNSFTLPNLRYRFDVAG